MTKITSFGQREFSFVGAKVLNALATLEKELGVKFSNNGGQYGTAGGFIRLHVEVLDTGTDKSGPQVEFERYAAQLGLKPEWFGQAFFDRGVEYKIVGVNLGSPKYRLQVERTYDKKQFKATIAMAKSGLEAAVAAGRIAA